jgi:molybdopterin molybdotransferase
MIPIAEALEIVRAQTPKLSPEIVRLEDSVGRILFSDTFADTDMPPFDRSQMDGFAVRAADTKNVPAKLALVGESAAGRGWHGELLPGQAVRIMTGAPVPAGADAVQKLELADENETHVTINEPAIPDKFIVRRGTEIRDLEVLFQSGERITPGMIAALAAFGYDRVKASRCPNVSILSTGSEIVEIDEVPGPDQIRNSNSAMLDALARGAGANTKVIPLVSDDLEKLKEAISSATGSDILVITGGVSVGKYDLTKVALEELGAEIFVEKVRLRPGKPMTFARLGETLIFGLPGNPVSAIVTFYLFVREAILGMQSANVTQLRSGNAILTKCVRAAKERETYLPCSLHTGKEGHLFAEALKFGGSSDFVGFAKAEALIKLERGQILDEGDVVEFLWIE